MKKSFLLFVTFVAMGLTSCSDDDSSSAALEGKWEFFEQGVGQDGQEVLVPYDHTEGCTKDFTIITATEATDHTFSMNGSTCEESTNVTPYTRDGNTITFTQGGETETVQIAQLDDSTLKIKSPENAQGQSVDIITVFKRVNE